MSVVTPRVVVVSESRITRRVIEMTFADQPLQLAVFAAGQPAIDDWQTRTPALLIADVSMPAPDGYALARELRAHAAGQRAAVLLLAGQADQVDAAAVADTQVSAVLRKPLDSHQLIDAVREALRNGPPPAVPRPAPVVQPVVATAGAVAVAEPEPTAAAGTTVSHAARVAADDVALLLGRESVLDGDTTAGAWVAAPPTDDVLADTFHALLEVEQGDRGAIEAPAAALSDADVDRIALRVAALAATDAALSARLEAAIVERVVRDVAPTIVEAAAQAAVRDEIARMRAATRPV
jgi:CheY-like chemotaxis protein